MAEIAEKTAKAETVKQEAANTAAKQKTEERARKLQSAKDRREDKLRRAQEVGATVIKPNFPDTYGLIYNIKQADRAMLAYSKKSFQIIDPKDADSVSKKQEMEKAKEELVKAIGNFEKVTENFCNAVGIKYRAAKIVY